jgi:hypothetical protein
MFYGAMILGMTFAYVGQCRMRPVNGAFFTK